MAMQRLSWLLSVLCSLVFLALYQKWLAWLILAAVVLLPLFSLLISLPAMLGARVTPMLPHRVQTGAEVELRFRYRCPLPMPRWTCRIRAVHEMSGVWFALKPGEGIPTNHCGQLQCRLKRMKVYDYLGIFALPLRGERECSMLVEPIPQPYPREQLIQKEKLCTWQPKPGGFAENHELRDYRPGDSVRQIHWKLSAKTGDLILREPMVPRFPRVLVRLELKGSPDALDRILGQMVWLGQQLLEEEIPFELQSLTEDGIRTAVIHHVGQLRQETDRLLKSAPAQEGALFGMPETATVIYDIGGEPHEA